MGWFAYKSVLTGELYTMSRNWLLLAGTVPPESVRPPNIKKYKKYKNMVHTCMATVLPRVLKDRGRATEVSRMLGAPRQ